MWHLISNTINKTGATPNILWVHNKSITLKFIGIRAKTSEC